MKNRAALYLRSSKDRSDVSIDAQRRELKSLAEKLNLSIVAEFSDAVESGKDNNRPGFQELYKEMCSSKRLWSKILVLDTARLSRRRVNAIVFEEIEAKRRNVSIIYKSLPDSDPITDMLLKSILQAMDEWHSLTSKQKGLAGMSENVRQGYRAGGRAPFGYELDKINTGTIRDGEPVTKSKLKPNSDAPAIRQYLIDKANGLSRVNAKLNSNLNIPDTTLISIEWNALTYAGHTVWNVHNERTEEGYISGTKRKPRAEWIIQQNTHEPLISDAQAEILLSKLNSKSTKRITPSTYLLRAIMAWRRHQYLLSAGKRKKSAVRRFRLNGLN
jgi:site-specific DNA recombinase